MAIDTNVSILGLVSQYNPLAVNQGSLSVATNASIRRENVAENRRGYNKYSTTLTGNVLQTMEYQETSLVHDGTNIFYDSDDNGTYLPYAGTLLEPDSTKIRFIETQNNLYVTSASGVQVISDLSGTQPRDAGMYRTLDITTSLSTSGTSFLSNGNQCAYRAVSQREDSNGNILLGAPSSRTLVINASGGGRNVNVTLQLHPLSQEGDIVRVYRSTQATSTTTDAAGDNLFLAYEYELSSADIISGEITFLDSIPDQLLSTPLYTNETQEGLAQANDEPPFCKDIAFYKTNYSIYANTKQKQTLFTTLVSVLDIRSVLSSGTSQLMTTSASTTATVSAASALGNAQIGWKVYGANIAPNTTIANISGTTITLSIAATGTGAANALLVTDDTIFLNGIEYFFGNVQIKNGAGSPQIAVGQSGVIAIDIADTARQIVATVNAHDLNNDIIGFYISGPTDLPGKMVFREADFGASQFSINCSDALTIGTDFFPTLSTTPITTNGTTSIAEENKNRFYYSKAGLAEAVPELNYFDVGPKNFAILRVIALRDSLIIIKEEGAYRLTGDTPTSFNVYPIDTTIKSKARDSFVALANQVYGLTDQGIVSINETSAVVISRPIEQSLVPLLPLSVTKNNAYGIAYESDRTYIIGLPSNANDTDNTQILTYNVFTKAWTRWDFGIECGNVLVKDDKLYFGKPDQNIVFKERKNLNNTDYQDVPELITILAIDGDCVTISAPAQPLEGDAIEAADSVLKIIAVDVFGSDWKVTLQSVPPDSWNALIGTIVNLLKAVQFEIKWFPWQGGSGGALKLVQEIKILTDPLATNNTVSELTQVISTDAVTQETEIEIESNAVRWGESPWGVSPWGGESESWSYVTWPPQSQAYCRLFELGVSHSIALEKISVVGYSIKFEVVSEKTNR